MIKLPQKKAVGSAHSKLILVGEHAVVYGKPAIALPFPTIKAQSTVEELPAIKRTEDLLVDCRYYVGPLEGIPTKLMGIAACINETLKVLGQQPIGIRIHIQSSIPIGRGLGSSAAVAIAIVRSLYKYFNQDLQQDRLMQLVSIAETHAHGNPSGIDMEAASSDIPIWFQKNKEIIPLQMKESLHLVVADTGHVGDTRTAVEGIRKMYQVNPALTQQSLDILEKVTYSAKEALVTGNVEQLGSTMNQAQHELTKLGVSDHSINRLVQTARHHQALGAKLTGGGLGGCVIALAKNEQHATTLADAMRDAGAYETWHFQTAGN
ncbi:mevalonate kinase [Filibacter tadaridae]|uniref:mevalonate kinase n=1 Tax=Filibacter tadaridae TaxID=2483811 RepID=A0A3P5XFD4_9BACL|nr:mevalonate kinase [Filibacter tadaridae]VDC28938.1 mevalonate kinase [Filibacter tadaridae]